MKYLLVAIVVMVAIGIWRNNRRRTAAPPLKPRASKSQPTHLRQPEDMVACAHCGLHLPRSDAIENRDRSAYYCSSAHKNLGTRT